MIYKTVTFTPPGGDPTTVVMHRENMYLIDGSPATPTSLMEVVSNDRLYIEEHHPDKLNDYDAAIQASNEGFEQNFEANIIRDDTHKITPQGA